MIALRDPTIAQIVPRDVGAVEGLTFYREVTRTFSVDDGLIRMRDRTAAGEQLADIGYPPEKALAAGLLLIEAALRSDPSLRSMVDKVRFASVPDAFRQGER